MSQLFLPDKAGFIQNFLKPIGRLSETAILTIEKNQITSLSNSIDNTVILYAQYLLDREYDEKIALNIPNIERFIKSLKVVDTNDIELKIESNNVQYKSANLKFKFHLYEDGILSAPKLNVDKIKAFKYDVNFTISSSTLGQLVKSSLLIPEVSKVYLYSEGDKIHAELNDRRVSTSDMFSFCIKEGYEGPGITTPVPLMLDTIRSMSSLGSDVEIGINNEVGVVQFKICTNQSILQYIITSIVS